MARYREDLHAWRDRSRGDSARRYGRDFRYGEEYRGTSSGWTRGPGGSHAPFGREGRRRAERGFGPEQGTRDPIWFGGYGGQGMEEAYMRYYSGRRGGRYDREFRRGYDRGGW